MNKFNKKVLLFVYEKGKVVILYASRNLRVRALVVRICRVLIRAIPKNFREVVETRWAYDLAAILHEAFRGAGLFRSHSFAKVLGQTKTISFVFPYYKKKDEIINAIRSLKDQKYVKLSPCDIEIIVIDDGSQELLDDLLDDDVIYLRRNKFKYGISRCRNLGAKVSSGRVLCFVDPDFVFPHDYVETLYSEFLRYGPRTVISGYIYDYFYKGCEDPRVAFGVWENPNKVTKRFLQLAGGHMAIDRNLFFNIGGFDEDLIYGEVEDTYFGFLLSQQPDVHIVFSTNVNVRHIPHPAGLAHAKPLDSYAVSAFKSPEFFKSYVIDGKR
jgi:hypothetical protein